MQRICLLALIGLPAAGKTTFCHWLLNAPDEHLKQIHICYDNILYLQNLNPKNSQPTTAELVNLDVEYKKQRLEIHQGLKELVKCLKMTKGISKELQDKLKITAIETRNSTTDILIICDDNNYYTSMRYQLFKICRENSLAYVQIYFECDLQQSLDRNHLRSKNAKIPERIILQMANKIEKPNSLKNFWEDQTLFINERIENVSYDVVLPFLKNAFKNVIKPLEITSAEIMEPTIGHQLDLLLRRRIKQLLNLEELDNEQKKLKAQHLNKKRKEIMAKLKVVNVEDNNEINLYKFVELMS